MLYPTVSAVTALPAQPEASNSAARPGADGILKQAQAFPDKGPVFPHQRHNVRDGSDGRQISADIQKLVGVAFFHSGTELERHPGTAQKLERAFIIGTVGVHDGPPPREVLPTAGGGR